MIEKTEEAHRMVSFFHFALIDRPIRSQGDKRLAPKRLDECKGHENKIQG